MSDGGWWIEIVFLAMLAGFIALRLYSVLGRRPNADNPASEPFRPEGNVREFPRPVQPLPERQPLPAAELPADTDPAVRTGVEAIMAADRSFDPARFLEGAKGAYRMILEAFWRGDSAALEGLVADDVLIQFKRAIAQREEDGLVLENRLVGLDDARIVEAGMSANMAEVSVRFDGDLVAVTRDRAGNVVAGSTTDAVPTHDIWTFSRHTSSSDPNWLLVATDAGE